MVVRIVNSNRYGELPPATLVAFEKGLGVTLPEPYRTHLLTHNGGTVAGAGRSGEVDHHYGLHDGPGWARFPRRTPAFDRLVPRSLFPIADDPGGNLICLVLSGPSRGAIHFWDHERSGDPAGATTELAPDFDAYLRGLVVLSAVRRKRTDAVVADAVAAGLDVPVYAGKVALDLAVERGSLRMVKALVAAGARVTAGALMEAVRNDAINTVRLLLSRGADVNYVVPQTGFTALMLASSGDNPDVAAVLLANGADKRPVNRWGKVARDLAHTDRMRGLLTVD